METIYRLQSLINQMSRYPCKNRLDNFGNAKKCGISVICGNETGISSILGLWIELIFDDRELSTLL